MTDTNQQNEQEKEQQEQRECERLLGKLVFRYKEFDPYNLSILLGFVEILEHDTGCTSPAEEFITGLVLRHTRPRGGLTPEHARKELDEFEENFKDAIERTRSFVALYPITPPAAEQGKE